MMNFRPFYLENDEHFEKHYWTIVVQNDVPSLMHFLFFRYLLPLGIYNVGP